MKFCTKCGAELKEGAAFCTGCGAPVPQAPTPAEEPVAETPAEKPAAETPVEAPVVETPAETPAEAPAEKPAATPVAAPAEEPAKKPEDKPAKGKKKALILTAAALAVVAVAAIVVVILMMQKSNAKKEQQALWDACVAQSEQRLEEARSWQGRLILSPSEEQELDRRMAEIADKMETAPGWDGEGSYEEIRAAAQSALERDWSELDGLLDSLRTRSVDAVDQLYAQLGGEDVSWLGVGDVDRLNALRTGAEERMNAEDYRGAMDALVLWQNAMDEVMTPKNDFIVQVQQYDLSDYPTVRAYVDVTDYAGGFIAGLGPNAFYVNEARSVGGPVTRRTVTRAAQINENSGISIGLVADVSGSMYYELDQAKAVMRGFMNTVQFDKGDEVELVAFADTSYICNTFTTDRSRVLTSIDSLSIGDCTRLYDTLISEIERIPTRSNAKCIIAFTDGYDNLSVHTAQDVVNKANAYRVPVFLIGVGSGCDEGSLRRIAEGTGGFYQNAANIGGLEAIYNAIYRQAKEVYLVEFDVDESAGFDQTCYLSLQVRAADGRGGHLDNYAINTYDFFGLMYSKFLVAGMDCQSKGERNLLESGLITTNAESYSNHDCVAWQSEEAIRTNGPGSKNAHIFEVLTGYQVLDVRKDGDGYILYGLSEYDVSREKKWSACRSEKEKSAVTARYGGDLSGDTMLWIEESIYNYEKLTLIRDTDGKWKFHTRVYERPNGSGSAYGINEVYQVSIS